MSARKPAFTPIRQDVLDILRRAGRPLAAYAILEQLERGAKKPQTVYRALDYLIACGAAHRLESLNAYVACQQMQAEAGHHAAFLICRRCRHVRELQEIADLERIMEGYGQQTGFTELRGSVEIRGLCATCRESEEA